MGKQVHDLARLLLHHSLRVKSGERVLIRFDTLGAWFADVLGQETIKAGCHPVFSYSSLRVAVVRLNGGTEDQVEYVHPSELAQTDCDCQVLIEAAGPDQLPELDAERLARRREATAEWRQRIEQIRYVIVAVPTPALANRLQMTYPACRDLLLRASTQVDWRQLFHEGRRIRSGLAAGSEVRIVASGTDLRFSLQGRRGVIAHGRRNVPDFELYYAPIGMEGYVHFPATQRWAGTAVAGITLEFRHGEVVAASARTGAGSLNAVLSTDAGARRVGEFGIGLNPMITALTGEAMLDEKIAGTVHLALGSSPATTDGDNQSAIHWDLVLDLRLGGLILLDGRVICRDGRWLFPQVTESQAVGT